MSEGGENSNSVRGSGVDFEFMCTPCADEGNSEKAMKYCPECKEYLCAACIKCHVKVSATKKHMLHDNEYQHCEGDSVDNTSDEEHVFKCVFHPDRDIEMFCFDHEMVYCLLCVAKDHRQCSRILELEEAAEKIPMNIEDDILQPIDSLQADIHLARQMKKANLIALDQSKSEILKTIEDTECLIIDKVKELASEAKGNACSRYDGLKRDVQEEDDVLLQGIIDTDEIRNKVKSQVELDAKRQFARHILQKHVIVQTKNKYDTADKDEKRMKCFKNDELIRHVLTAEGIVQVVGNKRSLNVEDNPVHKQSQKEVTIKGQKDYDTCSIYGICQLSDGTVVLADNSNKSLKKLDKNFRITETLALESNPMGLCLTGKSEVAVKLKNDTVLFVSIDDKFIKSHSIYIKGGDYIGLISICNELWYISSNDIMVYNRDGMVKQTFKIKSFAGTKFKPSGSDLVPVVADKEFIYVSDLNSQVACIDREGSVWSVMESERLKFVRRACIARSGIICVAGYTSGNIMMFNEKGKCLGELVDGLVKPDALFYDNKTRQLIVGHKNKNTITIINTD